MKQIAVKNDNFKDQIKKKVDTVAKKNLLFINNQLNILMNYTDYARNDETFRRDASYTYYALLQIRKNLLKKYLPSLSRKTQKFPTYIISKDYNNHHQTVLKLNSENKDYSLEGLKIPDVIINACETFAKKTKRNNSLNENQEYIFTIRDNRIFIKDKKLPHNTKPKYYEFLFNLIKQKPDGGEIKISEFMKQIGFKQDTEKFIMTFRNAIVNSRSFQKKLTDVFGDKLKAKDIISISGRSKLITFNNLLKR